MRYLFSLITVVMFMWASALTVQATDGIEAYEVEVITVYARAAGYHHINIHYAAVPGFGSLSREVRFNGVSESVYFRRTFVNENENWRLQTGNQVRPAQVETQRFTDFVLEKRTNEPIALWLEAGANQIELVVIEGEMVLGNPPEAIPVRPLLTYAQYRQQHAGVTYAPGGMITIQAQDAVHRSSPALFPINDRTCPLVYPFHPSYIRINNIGGIVWRVPGQRIEWEVYVPVSGMYRISLRYTQRYNRGTSPRALLINGAIPFEEAADIRFDHQNHFTARYLYHPQTGADMWFYFPAGFNTIALEVTMGAFAEIIDDAIVAMVDLSRIYQDIIMITSANPDRNRDYMIAAVIPDLQPRLREQAAVIQGLIDRMDAAGATFAENHSILLRLYRNINRLADRPYRVALYLSEFHSSITALGLFITRSMELPLQIDTLGIAGLDATQFPGRAGFFARIWHRVRALVGSFFVDFEFVADTADDVETTHIEVWISTGFDLFNILGRLINDHFVQHHPHISVDLRLVDAGIIFPASLTGRGPDVVLQAQAATPINFAHRGGAVDLTQFADFEYIASRFPQAAMDTFEFQGAIYALPDQMTFNVLFYRRDVFEDLGIAGVPNTIPEFISLLPPLQANQMDIFFTTGPTPMLGTGGGMVGATTRMLNPVYVGILHQLGGAVYNPTGAYSLIATDVGIEAFRKWTDLYTRHNFIVETDVMTRFRTGNLPVVVADIATINHLNAGAPEIHGLWGVAPVPGLYNAEGEFRRDTVISVSSNFIVGNMVEQRDNKYEAWEFLKWFTSDEIQERFAIEVEAFWGHHWRYLTANINTFERLGWGRELWPVLEEKLDWLIAIPQVPGGYIAGRAVNNAFLQVVIDNRNPIDAIFLARDQIDRELTVKRREFGIID